MLFALKQTIQQNVLKNSPFAQFCTVAPQSTW